MLDFLYKLVTMDPIKEKGNVVKLSYSGGIPEEYIVYTSHYNLKDYSKKELNEIFEPLLSNNYQFIVSRMDFSSSSSFKHSYFISIIDLNNKVFFTQEQMKNFFKDCSLSWGLDTYFRNYEYNKEIKRKKEESLNSQTNDGNYLNSLN